MTSCAWARASFFGRKGTRVSLHQGTGRRSRRASRPRVPTETGEAAQGPPALEPLERLLGPAPPTLARDLACLTRLWLLAEMIFVALGFHRTKSASEPTATRPFLG